MKRRKRRLGSASVRPQVPVEGAFMAIKINFGEMPSPEVARLPGSVRDKMDWIRLILPTNPGAALAALDPLLRQYPKVLCLQNWRIACLRVLGETKNALEASGELFRNHPEYLFARLGLVELFLEDMNILGADELLFEFGPTLTDCAGGRTVFHISEARMWFHLCGRLDALKGELDGARSFRNLLNDLESNSPSVQDLDRLIPLIEPKQNIFRDTWKRVLAAKSKL